MHRSGDRHHYWTLAAQRARHHRYALSAPRSSACRKCDQEARKGNENSRLSARLLCDVLVKKGKHRGKSMAGGLGFEPRLTESESAVLPLNYPPIGKTPSLSPRFLLLVSARLEHVDATPAHLGHLGRLSKRQRPKGPAVA